jgi:hypothetical protein
VTELVLAPGAGDIASDRHRKGRASVVGTVLAAVPFVITLWDYGVHPLRTALPTRIFSNLFDIQAEAFLRGDLAVPTGSLGIEGFRHDGHEYLYFGPLPAILRLPFAASTQSLDGRLSAPSMLLAWIVAAIFVSLTVWRIRAMVTPERSLHRVDVVTVTLFIAVVLGGSPVLLLAATPWAYTEALIWAFAMTMGALYALLGVLQEPTTGRILATALLTLGTVLSRVTAGWGCALAVIGVGVLLALSPSRHQHRSAAVWVIAAGAVPLTIGVAINIAKFGHAYMIPFDDQVWTAQSAARQAVLADGGVVGLRFLPTTLVNYLRPDGVRLSQVFPFLSPPAEPARSVGGVLLEMNYRTPSATAFMPLLFILAVIGAIVIARPGAAIGRASLRIPILGALAITSGMLLVGYIAPRYIVEFLPAFVVAGAAGLFAVLARIETWTRPRQFFLAAGAVVLALFGGAANAATALSSARVTAGGAALRDYVDLQRRVSDHTGHPLDDDVTFGDVLPTYSDPDELFIAGACQAFLVGTGELYRPWIALDVSPLQITARLTGAFGSGSVDVVSFDGSEDAAVTIELDDAGAYRVVTTGTQGGFTESVWNPIEPDTVIDITVGADVERGRYLVDVPGYVYTETSMVRRLQDPRTQVVLARPIAPPEPGGPLEVTVQLPTPSPLCAALLEDD